MRSRRVKGFGGGDVAAEAATTRFGAALLLRFEGFFEGFDFYLQFAELDNQFGQTAEGGLLAQGLTVGQGGGSADNGFGGNIFGDAAGAGDHGAVTDGDVIADGRLPTENHTAT